MTQRARTSISHAPTRSLTAPNAGRPACPTAESQRGEQGTATLGEDAAHECDAADRAGRRHLSTPSCHCGAQARESYRSADPAHRPSFPRPASSSRRVAVSSSGAALCAERVADERRRLLDKSVAGRCGGSWKLSPPLDGRLQAPAARWKPVLGKIDEARGLSGERATWKRASEARARDLSTGWDARASRKMACAHVIDTRGTRRAWRAENTRVEVIRIPPRVRSKSSLSARATPLVPVQKHKVERSDSG